MRTIGSSAGRLGIDGDLLPDRNQRVREHLAAPSADLIWSVDLHDVEDLISPTARTRSSTLLTGAGRKLEELGAEVLLVCSNTYTG